MSNQPIFYANRVANAARLFRTGNYASALRAYDNLVESTSTTYRLLSHSKIRQVSDTELEFWKRRVEAAIRCRQECQKRNTNR